MDTVRSVRGCPMKTAGSISTKQKNTAISTGFNVFHMNIGDFMESHKSSAAIIMITKTAFLESAHRRTARKATDSRSAGSIRD